MKPNASVINVISLADLAAEIANASLHSNTDIEAFIYYDGNCYLIPAQPTPINLLDFVRTEVLEKQTNEVSH